MYSAQIINRVDGEHTTYTIQVAAPSGQQHVVSRRYNDFAAIDRYMRPRFPGRLPDMPEKSFWRKTFMPGFLDQREKDLNLLIQGMISCDPFLNDGEVRTFFGVVGISKPGVVPTAQYGAAQAVPAYSQPVQAAPAPVRIAHAQLPLLSVPDHMFFT